MTTPPAAPRSAAEQAMLDAALVELFEHQITFNQVIGLRIESVRRDDVRARFDMRPELVGHRGWGRLHGGVISSVLDALAGLALMVEIAERHPNESAAQVMHRFLRLGTIDLRVDFLRPGIGHHFIGTAEVTRLGGRVGATQMRLHDEHGTLIATGAASFIVS